MVKNTEITDSLSQWRSPLMGLAILFVLLYHTWCTCYRGADLIAGFKYLYFGVDMFMLLSGFGCCFSYEKYGIKRFYYRRAKRIFPLFWIQVIVVSVISACLLGKTFSLTGFLFECSSLSYWKVDNHFFNWFVSAILLLYLLFPVFFKLCKKWPIATYSVVSVFSLLMLLVLPAVDWRFDCLISRIPIFFFGILLYRSRDISNQKFHIVLLMSLLLWLVSVSYDVSRFYSAAMLCPLIVLFLLQFTDNVNINGGERERWGDCPKTLQSHSR